VRPKQRRDWERLIFRFFGVCLGIIFAAYLTVGPLWICKSIDNLNAQEPQAFIVAHWDGDTLIVQASPGSLSLVGGGRDPQYIGREFVTLPASGVSIAYAPQLREGIILKDASDQIIASIPIPPYLSRTVYLPLISGRQAPPVYHRYFPLLARP